MNSAWGWGKPWGQLTERQRLGIFAEKWERENSPEYRRIYLALRDVAKARDARRAKLEKLKAYIASKRKLNSEKP